MRLFTTLRLLARSGAPAAGASTGAMYYDTLTSQPQYHDGLNWNPLADKGFPQVNNRLTVPDNRQVTYFDCFVNDGVLIISGSGTLVGMR